MKWKKYLRIIIILKLYLSFNLYSQNTQPFTDTAIYFFQAKQYEKSYLAFVEAFSKNLAEENMGYNFYCFSVAAEMCGKTETANKYLERGLTEGIIRTLNEIAYLKETHPLYIKNKQSKSIDSLLLQIEEVLKYTIRKDSLYYINLQDTSLKISHNPLAQMFLAHLQTRNISTNRLLKSISQYNSFPVPPKTNHFALYVFESEFEKVPYIVYIPKNYRSKNKHPLFVFLHGGTANLENFTFNNEVAKGEPIFKWDKNHDGIVLYPLGKKNFGWHEGEEPIKNVYGMIDHIKMLYNIDDADVNFIGMSNGARGVIYTALHNPICFRNFIAISSSPDFYKDSCLLNNLSNKYDLNLIQGTNDEVYPYIVHKTNYNKIYNKDLNFKLTPFDKGEHGFIYTDSGYTFFCDQINKITNLSGFKNSPINTIVWTFDSSKYSEYQWLKSTPTSSISNMHTIQIKKNGNDYVINHLSDTSDSITISIKLFYTEIDLTKPVCIYNTKQEKIFEKQIMPSKNYIISSFKKEFDRTHILIDEIFLKL